ncbi:unnamed protein product, partial [Mesorhabditis belari]|uniref:Uncharacterized protein n=1 Tax=Mesorhabditis belari TaxID=2138241 RepID=A0AAF3EUP6_9BILA
MWFTHSLKSALKDNRETCKEIKSRLPVGLLIFFELIWLFSCLWYNQITLVSNEQATERQITEISILLMILITIPAILTIFTLSSSFSKVYFVLFIFEILIVFEVSLFLGIYRVFSKSPASLQRFNVLILTFGSIYLQLLVPWLGGLKYSFYKDIRDHQSSEKKEQYASIPNVTIA